MTGRTGCPVCGAPHSACGQPSTSIPVDLPREEVRTVGKLKRYRVTVNGNPTVLKLTEDAAAKYDDATPVDETPTDEAPTKATPVDETSADEAPTKARTASNKSRTAATKGGNRGSGDS